MTQKFAALVALTACIAWGACDDETPKVNDPTTAGKSADKGKKGKAKPPAPIDHKKFDIDQVDERRFVIDDEALTQLLVDGVAGQIHVTKVSRGYRLDGYADDTLVTKLGLKKGDVLVTVNDAILNNLHQVRVAFAKARKDGTIRVAIERDGSSIQRRYYFRRNLDLGRRPSYLGRYRRRSKSLSGADYSKEKVLLAMKPGIKKVSDSHVQVDREIMAVVNANRELLKDGLRWYRGLKKGYGVEDEFSFYTLLALTKYDAILKINGDDTDSRYTIRDKLAEQNTAKELTITVERLGEELTIRYQLVDGLVDKAKLTAAVDKWREDASKYDRYGRYGRYGRYKRGRKTATTVDVKQINDTTFELPYKDFKEFWSGSMSMMRGARVVPSVRNGKPNGMKLYAIRPSSLWSKLGFQNGDTLQEIGGVKLDSASAFLSLTTSAFPAGTKKVTARVLRRYKTLELVYHLK